jgi:hypothetical protein
VVLLIGWSLYAFASSIKTERVERLFADIDYRAVTTADLEARREDPLWYRLIERGLGRDHADPAARAERILQLAEPRETGAVDCRPSDTARVLSLLTRIPELSDAELRQVVCGGIPTGVTVPQLRALLGAPARVGRLAGGEEEWVYAGSKVRIREGRVVAVQR